MISPVGPAPAQAGSPHKLNGSRRQSRVETDRARPDGGPFPFLELDAAHADLRVLPDLDPAWFRARRLKIYAS
jgi:hypothetical protein